MPDSPKARVLKPMEEYWLALGRFVSQFSQLERQLQVYLMIEAGVSYKIAPAIFSGTRIDTAKSYIKRLREVNGKGESKFLDRIFSQITVITGARNDILHYGANFKRNAEEGIVSQGLMAMPGRDNTFPVSRKILGDLCADLNTISAGIAVMFMEGAPVPDEIRETFQKGAEAPWRYTHPKPAHTRQPRQKGAKKQPPPPKPSKA